MSLQLWTSTAAMWIAKFRQAGN